MRLRPARERLPGSTALDSLPFEAALDTMPARSLGGPIPRDMCPARLTSDGLFVLR